MAEPLSPMSRPFVLLVLLAPLLQGCVAVAAAGVVGVGVVQYQRNESERDFSTDLQTTWKATLEGLTRLGFIAPEAVLGPTEGVITQADLCVRVERHAEGFTRVRVRLGTFHTGDHQRRSEIVLQEIGGALAPVDELRDWAEKAHDQAPPAANPATAPPK